jgi:hypothetical protein
MAFLPLAAWQHVAARCVVVVGMLALTATSDPEPPSFFVSASLATTFEVAPNTTRTQRFLLRVEGHPVLVGGAKVLRIDGSGAPPPLAFPVPDAGPPSALLPQVFAEGVAAPAVAFSSGELVGRLAFRLPAPGCETSDVCELEIAVALSAEATRRTAHLTLVAGVHDTGNFEPPPGRVTFVALEVTP